MKNRFLFFLLIASAGLNAFLLYRYWGVPSLTNSWQTREGNDIFSVSSTIDKKKLEAAGFKRVREFQYSKFDSGFVIEYDYLPETDLLYTKTIYKHNCPTDSTAIANLLDSHNISVISPMIPLGVDDKQFFIKDRTNGEIIHGRAVKNHLVFTIDIPDTPKLKRSKNRTIGADGSVKLIDSGGVRVHRNDNRILRAPAE